jgi:phosphoenolpyruvate carboxykinase (GTP)
LLWLLQLKDGQVHGTQTAVGIVPTKDELDMVGVDIKPEDLDRVLSIDSARWTAEMAHREQHLAKFDALPEEIWAAHRRVAAALAAEAEAETG